MPCSFIQPLGKIKTFIGDLLCVQGRKVGPEEKQHATFVFMGLGVSGVRMGREALNQIITALHSVPRGPEDGNHYVCVWGQDVCWWRGQGRLLRGQLSCSLDICQMSKWGEGIFGRGNILLQRNVVSARIASLRLLNSDSFSFRTT